MTTPRKTKKARPFDSKTTIDRPGLLESRRGLYGGWMRVTPTLQPLPQCKLFAAIIRSDS